MAHKKTDEGYPIFRSYLEEENDKPYYSMNTLSFYYEDMERKQELIETLAKKIVGYDLTLTDNLETIQQEVEQRINAWDDQVEQLPETVNDLLTDWVTDGTIDTIIEDTRLNLKADKSEVRLKSETIGLNDADAELIAAIQNKEGETTFNLLSIPQPASVTPEKLSFGMMKLAKGVEVLPFDPPLSEMFEGRTWIVKPPNVFIDSMQRDTNTAQNFSLAAGTKISVIYTPEKNVEIMRYEVKLTSRQSTLHDTGNDILLSICEDNGAGLPDTSKVLASSLITGNPNTPDTVFTGVADFDKLELVSGTKYHFITAVPNGSGLTFYSYRNFSGTLAGISMAGFNGAAWATVTAKPAIKIHGY